MQGKDQLQKKHKSRSQFIRSSQSSIRDWGSVRYQPIPLLSCFFDPRPLSTCNEQVACWELSIYVTCYIYFGAEQLWVATRSASGLWIECLRSIHCRQMIVMRIFTSKPMIARSLVNDRIHLPMMRSLMWIEAFLITHVSSCGGYARENSRYD